MADGLDVVTAWVADEHRVVGPLVLRPDPWLVQDLCPTSDRRIEERIEERVERVWRGRLKGDLRLFETLAGLVTTEPEGGAIMDRLLCMGPTKV